MDALELNQAPDNVNLPKKGVAEQKIKQLSDEVEERLSLAKEKSMIEFGTDICIGQDVLPSFEQRWSDVKTESFDESRDTEAQLFSGLRGLASAKDVVSTTEMVKDFLRTKFNIEFSLNNRVELRVRQYSKGEENKQREPFEHGYFLVVTGDNAETYAQKIEDQFHAYIQELRESDSYQKGEGLDFQRLLNTHRGRIIWGGNK